MTDDRSAGFGSQISNVLRISLGSWIWAWEVHKEERKMALVHGFCRQRGTLRGVLVQGRIIDFATRRRS